MRIWPWITLWLLWTLITMAGIVGGLMLPTADPLLPFAPVAIALLTGLGQTLVVAYLKLVRQPWLWGIVTAAGGCINFLMAFVLINAATLAAVLSGIILGLLQSLLLRTSPRRRLRWTSTQVLWVIVTALSYGLAAYWVISQQGIGGSQPSIGVSLGAGFLAGGLKGAVLATLVVEDTHPRSQIK